MKTRTMNELRQEKNYGYKPPLTHNQKSAETRANGYKTTDQAIADQQAINRKLAAKEKGYTEIDIDTTKELIIKKLSNEVYDIMFEAVNEEMSKHEVFQEETYFTPQGFEEFQDTWFEFHHEHFGEIMNAIKKSFTN